MTSKNSKKNASDITSLSSRKDSGIWASKYEVRKHLIANSHPPGYINKLLRAIANNGSIHINGIDWHTLQFNSG